MQIVLKLRNQKERHTSRINNKQKFVDLFVGCINLSGSHRIICHWNGLITNLLAQRFFSNLGLNVGGLKGEVNWVTDPNSLKDQ